MPQTRAMPAPGRSRDSGTTLAQMLDKELARHRDLRQAVMDIVIHKALELGNREGQILGMQQVLLESMTCRFGPIPLKVRRRIERITSQKELLKLARRVVIAKTLAGLRL